MSEKKKKISAKAVIGWIVSIAVAIIGTLGINTALNNNVKADSKSVNNNINNQKQEQSITININGEEVELNQGNAQTVYNKIEDEKNDLNSQVDTLQEENNNLNTELSKHISYTYHISNHCSGNIT